jgi:hypothetical protein
MRARICLKVLSILILGVVAGVVGYCAGRDQSTSASSPRADAGIGLMPSVRDIQPEALGAYMNRILGHDGSGEPLNLSLMVQRHGGNGKDSPGKEGLIPSGPNVLCLRQDSRPLPRRTPSGRRWTVGPIFQRPGQPAPPHL